MAALCVCMCKHSFIFCGSFHTSAAGYAGGRVAGLRHLRRGPLQEVALTSGLKQISPPQKRCALGNNNLLMGEGQPFTMWDI